MTFPSDILVSLTNPGDTNASLQHVSELNRVFSGEVYAEFGDKNIFLPLTRNKVIPMGARSCQFKFNSRLAAVDYTPGNNIWRESGGNPTDATTMHIGSRTVALDKPVLAAATVTDYESFLNDFDEQSRIATEIGRALAIKMDERIARTIGYAAGVTTKAYTTATGGPPRDEQLGTEINIDASASLTPYAWTTNELIEAIKRARVALDEKEVPEDDRFMVVSPATYQTLAGIYTPSGGTTALSNAIHKDYTYGNNGGLDVGEIMMVHGFRLQWSNRLTSGALGTVLTNFTSTAHQFDTNVSDAINTYTVDLRNALALFGHRDATATALGRGISIEQYWDPDVQSWKLIGKYYAGHAPLKLDAAGVIRSNPET